MIINNIRPKVHILRKRVNHFSEGGQLIPVERVNHFRMDRQMLNQGPKRSQHYTGKDTGTSQRPNVPSSHRPIKVVQA